MAVRNGSRAVAAAVALAVAYGAVAYLSLRLFALVNAQASPVWPASGIAVGALAVGGLRLWPGVLVGAFLTNFLVSQDPGSSLAISVGNTLEALLVAGVVRARAAADTFSRVAHASRFVAAALGGAMVAATIGSGALSTAGLAMTPTEVWVVWWLGDVGGILVVAPLVLAVGRGMRWRRPTAEGMALAAAAFLAPFLVFSGAFAGVDFAAPTLLAMPVLVWAVLRFSPTTVVSTSAAMSVIALVGTLQGQGPFAQVTPGAGLVALQGFVLVLSATGLVLAAAMQERAASRQAMEDAHAITESRVVERTRQLAQQKAAAVAAREALEDAQAIAHLGSWSWDVAADRVTWSPEMRRIFGVQEKELTYQGYLARIHPDDRDVVDRIIQSSFDSGASYEFQHRIVRPDGTVRSLAARGRVEKDDSGATTGMSGTALDVTETRAVEERFRALLEAAPDAFVLVDASGRIQMANEAAQSTFGYTREELLRLTTEDLVPEGLRKRHVGHREKYASAPVRRPMGQGLDLLARRKDGSTIPVEISLSPIETAQGKMVFAAVRDISERKRFEEEAQDARRRIQQREKLASLGTLAAGVGHEVRTPLTYIATNAAVIRLRFEKASRAEEAASSVLPDLEKPISAIQEGVRRIDRIVQQMRQFARGELKVDAMEPHVVVTEAVELWRATHRGTVDLEVSIAELPKTSMDKVQVQQVVINLLNNAAEVMQSSGRVRIRLRRDGDMGHLEVADQGPGIPAEEQARIWEPFYTTKAEGTGLGLAVSRRIVEAHGGTVAFESSSKGTTFHVRFPLGVRGEA